MSRIAERFQQIFERIYAEDYSSALTLICPLIDGAGKKLYGIKKPGERFKKVLDENNDFLYWMCTGGKLIMNGSDLIFMREGKGGINLSQSVYKLVRNNLLHEAELSDEIEFVDEAKIGLEGNRILFPNSLVLALAFMLSYLDCYKHDCPNNLQFSISGTPILLQEIWGDKEKVIELFGKKIFKCCPPEWVKIN